MPRKLLLALLILVIFYPPVFAKNESSRLKELGKKVLISIREPLIYLVRKLRRIKIKILQFF